MGLEPHLLELLRREVAEHQSARHQLCPGVTGLEAAGLREFREDPLMPEPIIAQA